MLENLDEKIELPIESPGVNSEEFDDSGVPPPERTLDVCKEESNSGDS